jgi:hypothetical protein
MPGESDFPARGKVTEVRDGVVVLTPINTNYQLHLSSPAGRPYPGPRDQWVDGIIRAAARKVMTVPSGGNFVAPIFGPPRTIQGRVRHLTDRYMVVQAGVPVVVTLPSADSAIDLPEGGIRVGSLVNVMAMPGATFEPLARAADTAPSAGNTSTRPSETQPV